MLDIRGVETNVGDKVTMLKTPICKEHYLVVGEVVKITPTRIHVEYDGLIYKRVGEQLIVEGVYNVK